MKLFRSCLVAVALILTVSQISLSLSGLTQSSDLTKVPLLGNKGIRTDINHVDKVMTKSTIL